MGARYASRVRACPLLPPSCVSALFTSYVFTEMSRSSDVVWLLAPHEVGGNISDVDYSPYLLPPPIDTLHTFFGCTRRHVCFGFIMLLPVFISPSVLPCVVVRAACITS